MLKKRSGKKDKGLFWEKFLKKIRKAVIYFLGITVAWVILYRFINPPITFLMIQRTVERLWDGKGWKLEKDWRDFDELSDNLKVAAIAGEDANFLNHWGFDTKAIQKAYLKNKQGKPIRGGSTISQQVAKNVFLWPGRSWVRKGFEAYFTLLIEIFWSKKRILEVYLNVAEMGRGVYGAEAATQYYYNKSSARLTKSQAALLIAVLPNPLAWSPLKPTRYVSAKKYFILRNMRRIKKLNFE